MWKWWGWKWRKQRQRRRGGKGSRGGGSGKNVGADVGENMIVLDADAVLGSKFLERLLGKDGLCSGVIYL